MGLTERQGMRDEEDRDREGTRDFVVVQWLRLHGPNARNPGLVHGQGTGSRML